MSILPWSKPKSLVPASDGKTQSKSLVPSNEEEIVIQGVSKRPAPLVLERKKEITISGKTFTVDPYELIRLIKRVTQTIGEYKDLEDAFGVVMTAALRKARGDLVNQLQKNFSICWQIDEHTGQSIFFRN